MATNLENFTSIVAGLYNVAVPSNAQLNRVADAILREIGELALIEEFGVGRAGMSTGQRAFACVRWERWKHKLLIGNDAEKTVLEPSIASAQAARIAAEDGIP